MSDGGKGSGRRPQAVTDEQIASNWDRIFGKNTTTVVTDEYEDKPTRNNSETQEALN